MTTPLTRELVWSTPPRDDAAAALALEPALMALVMQHMTTRVAVLDRGLRYTYANREALAFMGLPPECVVGRHMSEVLDAGVYQSFVPLLERIFGGESLHIEGWVEYEKQGRRFREQTLLPFRRGDGPVEAVVVCGLDHTQLRSSEQELAERLQELRASEALKSAIVDHALAALVTTDAQGLIVEFNPSAQAMFGRARHEVLGRPVSDVMIPERYRAPHQAGMARMQAGGAPRVLGQRMQLSAMRADGSEFPIEMVLWRTDVAGSAFYTASMVDVSQQHLAAQQIERQREALRQNEKLAAMGSLLAGVAHELNNPLAIVMGGAILLEDKASDPEVQADARRIREAAERCGRIVRTFLNMARSRPVQRSGVAVNELVHAAADLLQYALRTHGIQLELALGEGLPPVMADADQLGQIVLNLLLNAQQALSGNALQQIGGSARQGPGGPAPERRVQVQTGVEARRGNREPRVWLRVVDNGPGVPAELGPRIFDAFFTTKPEGMGTGLGLSASRAVARDHGGELILENPGAAGASFRLSLPISGEAEVHTAPAPLPQTEPPLLARVLVVDDEAELATLMRDMLERAGYDVATAEGATVALELLDEARFDAVVCDLRMPGMDGATFWHELSRRHPQLARRMLVVTGDTLSPDAREFLRTSRCSALDKPFSKADLLEKVAELLR
jgi:two-component system NtrC family sensor kinase